MSSAVFLLVLLEVGHSLGAKPNIDCAGIDPQARIDCGYAGISKLECEVNRRCCYDDRVPGVNWCFRGKNDLADKCRSIDVPKRVDCGYPGITREKCSSRECCWDDRTYNNPSKYCFYPKDENCAGIDPPARIDCGYVGITKHECENSRGCCYDDKVPGVNWCFRGKNDLADKCRSIDVPKRIDCGWPGITRAKCESKGCCWDDRSYNNPSKYCFYPKRPSK